MNLLSPLGRARSNPLALFGLLFLVFLSSFLGTTWLTRNATRLGLVQTPSERCLHGAPTPTGGGLSFALVTLAYLAGLAVFDRGEGLLFGVIVAGGLIIAVMGLWDDIRHLGAGVRLAIQFVVIGLAMWALPEFESWMLLDVVVVPSEWMSLVALLLSLWWINLFNFMDGSDGLAASEAIFVLGSAMLLITANAETGFLEGSVVNLGMAVTTAAVAGFLMVNWPPAGVFMGDVGSTFLGFVTALFAVYSVVEGDMTVWMWLILGGVFWIDASITLILRAITGERWYTAHNRHAYQLLVRRFEVKHANAQRSTPRTHAHRELIALATTVNIFWLLPIAFITLHYPQYGLIFVFVAWTPICLGVLRVARHAN